MKKNFVLLTVFAFVFVFLLTNIAYSLTVIPNAPWQQGFGIDTPAGSGRHLGTPNTIVYNVTNLNDSGLGSLRYGLEEVDSPKVIIFEVSGNIELQSGIIIGGNRAINAETKGSYITVAGQTAPSPGITLKHYGITIERKCHDILIQHIRIRPGDTSLIAQGCPACPKTSISDPFDTYWSYLPEGGTVPPCDLVIDHVSFSWGGDMNIQTGGERVTYMNIISSEALNSPLHPKGPHSKGFCFYSYNNNGHAAQNNALINSLIIHNTSRNPLVAAGSVAVANNVIFKHYTTGIQVNDDANNEEIQCSVVCNYIMEKGSETNPGNPFYIVMGAMNGSKIYFGSDNWAQGSIWNDPWNQIPDTSERQYIGVVESDVPEWAKCSTAAECIWPTGYTAMSATDAKDYVLANAGARPADRDSVDIRMVNDVINETGGYIASQSEVGGWPNLAKNIRALTVPSNPNEVQASGYTKLEEWLHGFLRTVEGKSSISPLTLKLQ